MALVTKGLPFLGLAGRRKRFNPTLCFVAQPELVPPSSPELFTNLIRSALRGGATSIQLRSKNSSTRQFIEAAHVVRQVIEEELPVMRSVPLIINDRVDVALAVNADGVHLGQDDFPTSLARDLLPRDKIIGVTVRNPKQARQALLDGADYLGTDAIFSTNTKPESNPLGLKKFAEICASTSLPVLGIGGITSTNAAQVIRAGASGVAVVSAIASSPEPLLATELLLDNVLSALPAFASNKSWRHLVAERWAQLRRLRPMIQHLTNFVVMNSTANVTLAVGARPVMTHETDLIPAANAVLLNIGTIDEEWDRRFDTAADVANQNGVPVILDPVGMAATHLRTKASLNLLSKRKIACVKGNAGEIGSLAKDASAHVRGVDSDFAPADRAALVSRVALNFNTVAAMTGKVDVVSDGRRVVEVHNNSCMLDDITGTGCAAAAVISAFIGSERSNSGIEVSTLDSVVAGLTCFAIAAEKAEERVFRTPQSQNGRGPSSLWTAVVDELALLTESDIIERAKIREHSQI